MGDSDREVMIEIKDLNKYFGDNHVVHNLNMKIYKGEFLTVLGSSGCGKTTILRMIGGFDTPTTGTITLEGEPVEGQAPYQRNINTVFQSYALFPHMTVFDNIAYGLRIKKMSQKDIYDKVMNMLDMVQLSGFEKRKIAQLSGGQKQRIAIARALVNEPKVLLLDEPLGALDLQLRKQMQVELKRLQRKFGITFIYVTHDQEEALSMSDRIAIMNGGFLEQLDEPKMIYEKPQTKFVADFIGETNTFSCYVAETDEQKAVIKLESGSALVPSDELNAGEMIYISVRPQKMRYSLDKVDGFSLQAVAREVLYIGTVYKSILVMSNGQEIRINADREEEVPIPGQMVYLHWSMEDAVIIHAKDNKVFDAVENMNLTKEKKVSIHG